MSGRLEAKICLVTGTGGSMGRATALAFAREGASIVGCDVVAEPAQETVDMVRAAGGQMASLHPSRISDPNECERLVNGAGEELGGDHLSCVPGVERHLPTGRGQSGALFGARTGEGVELAVAEGDFGSAPRRSLCSGCSSGPGASHFCPSS